MDFPITTGDAEQFAEELRAEGFDARTYQTLDWQFGLLVGPAGLDLKRLPTGEIALFFPLWEINASTNRPLIADRQFHSVVEGRPQGWTYHRPRPDPA